MRINALASGIAVTVVASFLVAAPGVAAASGQTQQSTIVSQIPAAYTPNIGTGEVDAIAQAGGNIVLGGTFSSVTPASGGAAKSVSNLTAYTVGTGALVSTFKGTTNGQVLTMVDGPVPNTVIIGGSFSNVDGVSGSVALINATTGAIVPGWTAPTTNGVVESIVLQGSQLFMGGEFTTVSGVSHKGLAVLNPNTGALLPYTTPDFTGHHNYGVNCDPNNPPPPIPGRAPFTCAKASPGLKAIDVTPDGTRLIATGNFTSAGGLHRDQAALVDLTPTGATVDPNWNTAAFTAGCTDLFFDTYMRAVQFSADGSYFVIVTTGRGDNTLNSDGSLNNCDSVTRWATSATGTNVAPVWIDDSGSDTFHSIAITGSAIYIGGHQRWMNDTYGNDDALEGSVPRPGLTALDPANGLPLTWNPGRNPRGQGTFALLATADGLYAGYDTDTIGIKPKYTRMKNAFFPLAGGYSLAPNATNSLPGSVYLLGDTNGGAGATSVNWNGSTTPGTPTPVAGVDWTNARGAFQVDGNVYYGDTDGNFYKRSFDGTNFGPAVAIDPYDDPIWDGVSAGTSYLTGAPVLYNGMKSAFYGEMSSLTSMFYWKGRVYYTLAGNSHMFYRYFEPEDGVMGATEFTTSDTNDWSHVAGAFISGNTLYFADSASKNLYSVDFSGGQANGSPAVADSSIDWTSAGAFLGPSTAPPVIQPPVASFTPSCTGLTCSFDGSASHEQGGAITSYEWDFGDGSTDTTTSAGDTHTYAAGGPETVSLTVTSSLDNQTNTATQNINPSVVTSKPVTFQGVNTFDGNGTSATTTIPATTAVGDDLVLFESYISPTANATTPAGWTLVGTRTQSNLTDAVYQRTAVAGDAGSSVKVTYPSGRKSALTLADYASSAPGIEMEAVSADSSTASHSTPTVNGLTPGSLALSFWSEKSTTNSTWTAPGSVAQRSAAYGSGQTAVSALLADSGSAVSGTYGGLSATTNATSGAGIAWTIALASTS